MNAAIYARYSSDNQREQSIDEQIREIEDYAIKKNYNIVKVYCDYAISGASQEREQFQKMLADSAKNLFDYVLVFDYTRFSRGGEIGLADEVVLTKNNVRLISITEDYGEQNFGTKLIKHVKFLMAEEDLNKLKINVARGQRENAVNCMHNGGTPPLGYDIDPTTKKYIVNEYEAQAVKIIFEMWASGNSYNDIIKKLNSLNYKTKRDNNDFRKNSLFSILKNKKYIGIYEYGKIKKLVSKNKEYKSQRVKTEAVSIENGVPEIISKELWNMTQNRIKTREPSKTAKVNYILSGKIKCGLCGANYVGTTRRSHQKNDYYYICSKKSNYKTCDNRAIKKDVIEKKVLSFLKEYIFSNEGIDWIVSELNKQNTEVVKFLTAEEITEINQKLKQIELKNERAKNAYLNSLLSLEEFRIEKLKTEEEKNFLNSKLVITRPNGYSDKEIREKLKDIKKRLSDDNNLILELLRDVVITNEKIDINIFSYRGLA